MPDTSVPDGTTTRFGIGQPVPRNEDPVLHTGQGRYTDDIALPGQLWCVIVRSQHARGRIRGIDTTMAKAMPGVRAVCAGADLDAAGCGRLRRILPFTNADGTPMQAPERGALATDRVRFVDDPVACIIAETRAQARDAAEAVVVDVDPLPAVVEASAAAAPGAPVLFDRPGGTVVLDFHYGNRDKVAEAFTKAAHTVRVPLRNNRVVVAAMEPRSALATYDPASGRSTIHIGSHSMFRPHNNIAGDIPKVPVEKVRVLTGNVGGSFGMKASVYTEYVCLLHAAKELGRPVK